MTDIITAEDMAKRDACDGYAFCCPLVGLYPCEQQRRGCCCHELHLKNEHDREQRARQWWLDAKAEMIGHQQNGGKSGGTAPDGPETWKQP